MKTAFITGATSGIGMEFARAYAKKGYRLILTGRRSDILQEFMDRNACDCRIITADLSLEDELLKLAKELEGEKIDVFINNAGFGTAGSFLETDTGKELSMIKVNDIAMHFLFKAVLKKMVKKGKGTIVNVASSAGLFPAGPYMAGYYASKAYVVSLTRAVARELKEKGSKVYVCCLCPGPVDTRFNDNADVTFALKGISAERCVRECLSLMKKKRTVIVPTLMMRAAVFWQRFVPGPILIGMVGRQQKKKTEIGKRR
ncbi:SDR family NAD(P)-dependent oxidoreductase [Butyrivibrio sp. MC2013]|uniref:SDR family NAD(P)-dependent oxidoreductase n=1 Tax=Butyrivibrio sp. MC2013 TaxID=1280686 RepID=UPI00041DBC8B|nr:SDR family oxidoreductase [Butyrivibrio sp. MC2013]